MTRRPLNERFANKVLAEIKHTTIRDKAWPMGKPIMLFRWSGKPYRSKQIEVAPGDGHIVEIPVPDNIDLNYAILLRNLNETETTRQPHAAV